VNRLHRINLTKHAIEALATPGEGKRASYYDTRVPGLGVMVQPTGSRQFFWFRRVRGRRTWRTIGEFPALSVENARAKAQEYNSDLGRWKGDSYEGPNPFEYHGEPTLTAVVEDYIAKHVRAQAKNPDRAEKGVRWTADKYLASFQNRRLGEIHRADVRQLHADIGKKHGQVTANRVVKLLKTLFYWATDTEMFHGENPARRLELFAERSRDRFLQPEEVPKFLTALRQEPNRNARDFTVISLFTGCRMMDVLSMRWSDISLEAKLWTIPNPKSQVPYVVALLPEVIDILKERRQRNKPSEWVFPSRRGQGHILNVRRGWEAILKRAEIPDLRRHDLRRTLGSWMAKNGTSLPVIGKALGHQSLSATAIYSRLDIAPVREAVQNAATALLTAGQKKPKPKKKKPKSKKK
jgi:integrase